MLCRNPFPIMVIDEPNGVVFLTPPGLPLLITDRIRPYFFSHTLPLGKIQAYKHTEHTEKSPFHYYIFIHTYTLPNIK